MSLKYSGLLFVLFVIVEAINGLALEKTSSPNITQDLPAVHSAMGKVQSENGSATTESVKIIIPNISEVITVKSSIANANNTTVLEPVTTTVPLPVTTKILISPSPSPSPALTPTPTPTPTPAPAPEKGYWVVRDKSNKTVCIIAEMMMQLNITYSGQDSIKSHVTNVPKNSVASGTCGNSSQTLNITWEPGYILQINFSKNKSANNFFISEMSLKMNASVFKDNDTLLFFNKSSEFMTPLDMSYKCSKAQEINLENANSNFKAVLTLKDTQFEAYMNKTKVEFGAAQDCETFDTPDIVPIAVGCALAILVIVVLVAYLIGRKRSLNRGYLSM